MTTPDTLAHIEAVLAAATEGPWLRGWWSAQAESKCICADKGELLGKRPQTIYPGAGPFHVHATDFFEDEHRLSGPAPACLSVAGNYDYEEGGIVRDADATFIAFARNTYPEALAVVRDYGDVAMQAHAFMHYGTWDACKAGICVQRYARLAAFLSAARDATEAGS